MVCPASTPEVVPESCKSEPFSAELITLSVERVLMVIATAARSTVTGWLMLVVVPAVLVPETAILTVPAGQFVTSVSGTPTLQMPSASTVAP